MLWQLRLAKSKPYNDDDHNDLQREKNPILKAIARNQKRERRHLPHQGEKQPIRIILIMDEMDPTFIKPVTERFPLIKPKLIHVSQVKNPHRK